MGRNDHMHTAFWPYGSHWLDFHDFVWCVHALENFSHRRIVYNNMNHHHPTRANLICLHMYSDFVHVHYPLFQTCEIEKWKWQSKWKPFELGWPLWQAIECVAKWKNKANFQTNVSWSAKINKSRNLRLKCQQKRTSLDKLRSLESINAIHHHRRKIRLYISSNGENLLFLSASPLPLWGAPVFISIFQFNCDAEPIIALFDVITFFPKYTIKIRKSRRFLFFSPFVWYIPFPMGA